MIRHFNATKRRTIARNHAQVSIRPTQGSTTPIFDIKLELGDYQFPPEAQVRVEAWRSNAVQRWDYGSAIDIQPPPDIDRRLTEVPQSAQFKVFVVAGDGSGRLLGLSQPLKPKLPRESLIPLIECDLGSEVWRIKFSEGDLPVLEVNNKLEMISEIVRSDAQFRALIMPEVLRSVLNHIVLEQRHDPDDDAGGWWMGWYRLARSHTDADTPHLSLTDQGARVEAAREWIDHVVAAFSAEPVDAVNTYAQAQGAL